MAARSLSSRYTFNSYMAAARAAGASQPQEPMEMGPSATYYEILKIQRGAEPQGVRAAYRRLGQ